MRKLILPLLALVLVLSSCEDKLTSLNNDPKSTAEVPADPLFSNAEVSLGTLISNPNYNINNMKFMAQYWAQTTYPDETQYDLTTRQIPSNYWSEIYRDVLKDLNDASSLVEEEQFTPDAAKQNMQAQIEILKVMGYYKLVTTFGNVPYAEALNPDKISPAYGSQAEIYADLLSRLNAAASNLDVTAAGFDGDVYYNGDIAAWIKLAHSLRMRLAMTVVDNPPSGVDPQAIVEDASPNAFTSNADNAIIQFTSTYPNTNPVWEELVRSGRHDFVPANTLVNKMNELDDPRRQIHFTQIDTSDDGTDNPVYYGGAYGYQNGYGNYSHMGDLIKEKTFEGTIISYDQVELIRAEAAARGWNVSGTASQHYNNAVQADMEYWSQALSKYQVSSADPITQQQMTNYLAPTSPAAYPTTDTDATNDDLASQLKAIAVQKWLASYPDGNQGWIDWRRFDHPTFNLATTVDNEDQIPVRFIYPVDEQNLNQANWEEASQAIGGDQTSTLLFWDTGYPTSVN